MTTQEFNYRLIGLKDQLFSFAWSLTRNEEEAKDLVQETYFKAIKYRDKFEDTTNQKAWTYTIMKNTYINDHRKSNRFNTESYSSNRIIFSKLDDKINSESPESEYAKKEINKTINYLNDEFRIPFLMYLRGYKYKEIADELNIKLGTVKSRIFIARRQLMASLRDYMWNG